MGSFVVSRRRNSEYQFNLKADNGEIILTSEGYTNKMACFNGISSVKMSVGYDSNFERKLSWNGQYYFNLKASNGQVIGTSEMYNNSVGRDNGVESVKRMAPTADVVDTTN